MFKCDLCNKEMKDKYKASYPSENILDVKHLGITFCEHCVEESGEIGVKDFKRRLKEREEQ